MEMPKEFPSESKQINLDLAKHLRAALSAVERGDLLFGTFIGIGPAGQIYEVMALGEGPVEPIMITALEVMKAKIISDLIRRQQETKPSVLIQPKGLRG